VLQAGDTIGPYTLIRPLGRGAFGEVWLAEKRSSLLTTEVALKFALVAHDDVDSVRTEAALWRRASGHPNVVPVLDAEVYDGQVVIASEYITGGNLHDRMRAMDGALLPVEAVVSITNGILAGLDYLHRAGLTHRDLKPENVLLQDGIPRLTDFGLARVLDIGAQTSNISGTPRYMAPETFSGFYSAASDLWSVGVMLHEMLSGANPFPTGDLMSLIGAIQSMPPAPLPETVPDRLRQVIARLLAKSPADRFAGASNVREALQSALAHSTSLLPAPSVAPTNTNLPVQQTSFIGRESEISGAMSLLDNTRLLTLTGSGGCGKTRLAIQIAEKLRAQFPGGVWLTELASLADPLLVDSTIAAALGITETAGQSILSTIAAHLKQTKALLLLDNCEHLLDAASRAVEALLRSCPELIFLATSREALNIAGEQSFRVPSLSLPDSSESGIEEICTFESIQLFVERAKAARPDFAVTTENSRALASICRRLDGIPLAIELAASRLRVLPLEEINTRLDNRFRLLTGGSRTALPRQQTLRAMIDWSYDLLDSDQKVLLCRLSVFSGGWYLEAAEAICADDDDEFSVENRKSKIEDWQVLDLLVALAEKNLVIAEELCGEARYKLLETVRQYARERLLEVGDGEVVRECHAAWFVSMAERAEPNLRSDAREEWLRRLEENHENLRSALEWSLQAEDPSNSLRLCSALARFWWTKGHMSEGREWCAAALKRADRSAPTTTIAGTLNGAGMLAYFQGDFIGARDHYQAAHDTYVALDDRHGIAASLGNLGNVADEFGDFATAREYQHRCLDIRRELGDRLGISSTLNNLGNIAYHQGHLDEARTYQTECLEMVTELGHREGMASALNNLGNLASQRQDHAEAHKCYSRCLEMAEEIGDVRNIAISLNNLGAVFSDTDQPQARNYFERALDVYRKLGDQRGIALSNYNLGDAALESGDRQKALAYQRESLKMRSEIGDRRGVAESLIAMARLASADAQYIRMAELVGAARALTTSLDISGAADKTTDDPHIRLQALIDDERAAALARGAAMSMDEAIQLALDDRPSKH